MTDQEAKAEAEKIVQEFYKAIPLNGFKGTYMTFMAHATQCAIIHVKSHVEESLLFGSRNRWERWKAILTELERTK